MREPRQGEQVASCEHVMGPITIPATTCPGHIGIGMYQPPNLGGPRAVCHSSLRQWPVPPPNVTCIIVYLTKQRKKSPCRPLSTVSSPESDENGSCQINTFETYGTSRDLESYLERACTHLVSGDCSDPQVGHAAKATKRGEGMVLAVNRKLHGQESGKGELRE